MRSGWTRLVRMAAAMLALAGGVWAAGAGAAEIKNVKVEYAWPWGAEIRYDVVGTLDATVPLVVTATDRANNASYTAQASALSGDTGSQAGAHKVLWELDKQGIKLQSTNVVFTVKYEPLYCVVDLSGGTKASSYPVTYMDEPPSGGFNTSAYKTTKLVLRRIPAGTFKMNGSCQVTLTKPFYAGLFEVTEKQWTLVWGSNPSCYEYLDDQKPVESVSYNMIRGGAWPASSAVGVLTFLDKLRSKTGLEFDLPTEAQWEYACRAGTTSLYNNGGNSESDLKKLGQYRQNSSTYWLAGVGSLQPNAWGLYDMHGNVEEWCLDWCFGGVSGGTDPKGASSGWDRVIRGGGWYSDASACTSNSRHGSYPWDTADTVGFRLFLTLSK